VRSIGKWLSIKSVAIVTKMADTKLSYVSLVGTKSPIGNTAVVIINTRVLNAS